MKIWNRLFGSRTTIQKNAVPMKRRASLQLEALETRDLMSANPLPVLMVIADQQDFYFQEYNDTRIALASQGVDTVVAATTTNTSFAHPQSGQGDANPLGAVTPDIALRNVEADNYSAIVFVGGWGSSMYQYAYNDPNLDGVADNFYWNSHYNGDTDLNDGVMASQKVVVNNLINEFLADDKPVAAICHGVTVLAWARVDGVSPLAGKKVSVPHTVGSPGQFYDGAERVYPYRSGQYDQVVANGGIANTVSGQYGRPDTASDDVVVDGRIITGENYDSSTTFGLTIAREVLANLPPVEAPVALEDGNLVVRGTAESDVIYVWSNRTAESVSVWINGVSHGPFTVGVGGHVKVFSGSGNDQVFATDLRIPVRAYGGEGHDLLVGGMANDVLDGGDGVDRAWGGLGDDVLLGGTGDDYLYGREGNDVLVGGMGNDYLEGFDGDDVLIGGMGSDSIRGGAGRDLLIGGRTSFEHEVGHLITLGHTWDAAASVEEAFALLSEESSPVRLRVGDTVSDDAAFDVLWGGADNDWLLPLGNDLPVQ